MSSGHASSASQGLAFCQGSSCLPNCSLTSGSVRRMLSQHAFGLGIPRAQAAHPFLAPVWPATARRRQDVTVTGIRCIDLGPDDWNPGQDPSGNEKCEWGPNCNSALAIIHDGWFGAVYPEGNTVNIYDNEYVDFDGNPITDRPKVRLQGDTSANYVSTAPPVQQASMLREPISTARNSSLRDLLVMAAACAVTGLAVVALALARGRTRAVASAARRAAAQAVDSGSSAAEGGLLVAPE
ncbi:unnamed protein product [Prorocentrum cordatum]|uniref:Uncharacterized protein n=1 Tax=Prorocentrum cordatum TaxID=2364126 RepID=A0ABN9P779_9DINO|nr:unnamed protein product [Polarella glacialis]